MTGKVWECYGWDFDCSLLQEETLVYVEEMKDDSLAEVVVCSALMVYH